MAVSGPVLGSVQADNVAFEDNQIAPVKQLSNKP